MPLQLTDATTSAPRITFDNSANTNFGTGSTSGPLSFNGKAFLSSAGTELAQASAKSVGMARSTGSVAVTPQTTSTISAASSAGFGSVSGGGGLVSFSSGTFTIFTTVNAYSGPTTPVSMVYSVF